MDFLDLKTFDPMTADPKTRREYVSWFDEMLRQQGQREWIEQEYAEKMAEAEQKHVADLAEAEQRHMVGLAEAEQRHMADLAKAEQRHKDSLLRLVQELKAKGVLNAELADLTEHYKSE